MPKHVTSYFATPPHTPFTDVATKLNEHIDILLRKGYVLHSVVQHQGIVPLDGHQQGVPCTTGYMIIALEPDTDPKLVISTS